MEDDDALPFFDDDLLVSRTRIGRAVITASSYAPKLDKPHWFESTEPEGVFSTYAAYYSKDYTTCLSRALRLANSPSINETTHKELKDLVLRCALQVSPPDQERDHIVLIAQEWREIKQAGFCESAAKVFHRFGQPIPALEAIGGALEIRGAVPRYMETLAVILASMEGMQNNVLPADLNPSSNTILQRALAGTLKGSGKLEELKDARAL
ncbi:hypothetical protein BT69DRAFT_108406 [Atractiella rhizophila]|nr:hypothetical protein BT69DRAFT_108406 [Atractiella rhizophila]